MTYEPEDLELVVDYHQQQSVESGHPPRNLGAWRNDCKRAMLENERSYPGYVERAAAGLRAAAQGKRITYCAESRGTHGISYVWSATGTVTPPSWWSRDEAKREHDEYEAKNAHWLIPARAEAKLRAAAKDDQQEHE